MGSTEGVARDVLFKVRRRREARETHCLAEEHGGFVERFTQRAERLGKENVDARNEEGKPAESAERPAVDVERAVERVRKALTEKEGVFALGRTGEGVARREMKVIGKVKRKGRDLGKVGEVEEKGKGKETGEAEDVNGKGECSGAKEVKGKGKQKCSEAKKVEGKGKSRDEEPVEEVNRVNGVGEKPEEEQRAEPEVKKPTYAMMLRKGEGSNTNPPKRSHQPL